VRLMTLNIWNYNKPWRERRRIISELIMHTDPDVVCLQETRHDFRFEGGLGQGEQIAALTERHATSRAAQVYWPFPRQDEGLTTLTRVPPERVFIEELSQVPDERADENRRICLGVTVAEGGSEIDVFNTHFSLGERARLLNARETFSFISAQAVRPALLFGDLNCRPDTDPIRFLRGEIEVDGATGDLVDCWTEANPADAGFTFASFNPYHRIDYAHSRNLAGRVRRAEIVGQEASAGIYASDHLGILIEVDLP
jgi:endonuclease/exonuclease/phosphatase family metal-dependent hydrolase